MAAPTLAATRFATSRERTLYFYAPRTGETVRAVYWTPRDGYIHSSLKEISWALRDHRNDQMKLFDPKLLDILYILQLKMDYRNQPFHIISGYRSPSTNAMLRARNRKVAKNSYHMYGKAVDLRMPDRRTSQVRRAALTLEAGGVGYYSRSNFVHVDTGPVRAWGR